MESKSHSNEEKVLTWPNLLYRELLAALLVMVVLWIWSLLVSAPLEMRANPTFSPNPAKAPWYFLGLQELLVYFDPWIAGVMVPALIIIGLMCIPYVDGNRKATGVYSFRERPFAVTFFTFGLFLWFSLILIGTLFRGPSWNWYWPWESFDIHKTVLPTRNLPRALGWALTLSYFGLGLLVPRKMKFLGTIDPGRYAVTMLFVLSAVGIIIKIFLRLSFNIKYILITPWFNI